jgi:hypothetical protein
LLPRRTAKDRHWPPPGRGLDYAKLREAWEYCTSFGGPHSLLVIRHGWIAGQPQPPISARNQIRLEAENFRHFEGYAMEDRNDKNASHRLNVRLDGGTTGRIRTRFDEPFAGRNGRYDVEVRYLDAKGSRCRVALFIDGVARDPAWESTGEGRGWTIRTIRDVEVHVGEEVRVDAEGPAGRLDYVQLDSTRPPQTTMRAGPEKGGLASLYSGDEGIDREPRVLFVEGLVRSRITKPCW